MTLLRTGLLPSLTHNRIVKKGWCYDIWVMVCDTERKWRTAKWATDQVSMRKQRSWWVLYSWQTIEWAKIVWVQVIPQVTQSGCAVRPSGDQMTYQRSGESLRRLPFLFPYLQSTVSPKTFMHRTHFTFLVKPAEVSNVYHLPSSQRPWSYTVHNIHLV